MAQSGWHAKIELDIQEGFSLEDDIVWPETLSQIIHHTLFENPETGRLTLEIFAQEDPKGIMLEHIETAVCTFLHQSIPGLEFTRLVEKDWVKESLKSLEPIEAGRFYVHGSHDADKIPAGKIPILIDASLAFGTGHHDTTRGCLLAIDQLAGSLNPANALDLGCGSGILAFAIKKIWPECNVVASELEAESVAVARQNAHDNDVADIPVLGAEGFDHPDLKALKFDLIVANILAKPLIDLAGEMAKHLKPGGHLVLSGLLRDQQDSVLEAYTNAGFTLTETFGTQGWPTLVLTRSQL